MNGILPEDMAVAGEGAEVGQRLQARHPERPTAKLLGRVSRVELALQDGGDLLHYLTDILRCGHQGTHEGTQRNLVGNIEPEEGLLIVAYALIHENTLPEADSFAIFF